ncbi:MAG: quinolinate synthase NadA [Clostridia bacterium]|nr:quinolinate synthase NadA [Clostridia bacterium]MBO5066756.1 quinolinate synthase NadA [Clostridia bacterium]
MNTVELKAKICEAKKETGTVILAHTYQDPDIIDIADITGDSFFLSKKAAEIKAKRVVMCGVRFMAESVKILSPETETILPVPSATCPMAEQILPERVREYKKENPDSQVVAYINTTAALKAECDVCVTSSSAIKIVDKLEADEILFIPDQHLGSYVKEKLPHKNIVLWDGFCPVHAQLTAEDVIACKNKYPDAVFAVHPESPAEVVKLADMVGATSEIINYAKAQKGRVIIGTERGVVDYLSTHEENGERFIQLAPEKLCCEDMKKISLDDIYKAIKGEGGEEIVLPEDLRKKALVSINRMLELG